MLGLLPNPSKILEQDLFEIIDVSDNEPEKGVVFLKQKVKNIFFDYKRNNYDRTSDCFIFEYSFNKYYIQEDIAVKTEEYLRNPDNKSKNISFDLTLNVNEQGEYSVGDLKINDVKIDDYFKWHILYEISIGGIYAIKKSFKNCNRRM